MAPGDRRFENDAFAPSHLSMARKYPGGRGRGRLYAFGGIAMLVMLVPFIVDVLFVGGSTVSSGPLSESHGLFGNECQTCHTPGEGVPDVKCRACHEKAGDPLGVHSFARHYLYRSADFDRSSPSTSEVSCATCHSEHNGRLAMLGRVADRQCSSCHEGHEFRRDHPEFRFLAESEPDPSNLRFAHVMHVREIVEEEELSDMEASCLRCHEPEPEGRYFQPISFARHCDACHMGGSTATPFLPPEGGTAAGVRTLAAARADADGIAAGADYWDPNEFRERGGQLQKRPLYHEDPWVMYNLTRLRRTLYPGAELADLLRASSAVPSGPQRVLHEEAIATLRARIHVLSGDASREVQDELESLEELLAQIERRLGDPYSPVDATRFDVSLADRAPGLERGGAEETAILQVVDSLTSECQVCHLVERATIARVQKDQRALHRAEFNHRAHIIHARCLDCHTEIPVRDYASGENDPPAAEDQASIQNVPGITRCRECHQDGGPSELCTSCHRFHPDRSHWSNLSRYRQTAR